MQVGVRTVEVRQGRLRVNGRAVTLRGANRHEHDPVTGHVVSEVSMLRDIQLFKGAPLSPRRPRPSRPCRRPRAHSRPSAADFNFNTVRCSHYPNDEVLLNPPVPLPPKRLPTGALRPLPEAS